MPLTPSQDTQLLYWKEKLKNISFLELYDAYPKPSAEHAREETTNVSLNADLGGALQELAGAQNTTLFTTILAVFKVLLYKHSKQEDICVGTPVIDELEEAAVNHNNNVLLLRSKLQTQVPFLDFLQQVKETTLEAYRYNDIPFEKVVEALVHENGIVKSPLFQIMMVWGNGSEKSSNGNGHSQSVEKKFDIAFFITENSGSLHCRVEFASQKMTRSKIQDMISDFPQLIDSIVANPYQTIGDLVSPQAENTMGVICDSQYYGSYRQEDHQTWAALTKRQKQSQDDRISKEYLDGFEQLKLDENKIINIAEVSERLQSINGWTLIPVTGLIPTRDFFFMILNKQYPVTVSIRKPWEIDFSEQPDIFHDVFGHLPLLTNEKFLRFLTAYSIIAFKYVHNPKAIEFLGRLYWYTYEMGIINEGGSLKPYGGAIITSAEELANIHNDQIPKYSFNLTRIFHTPYNPYKLQKEYFVINSFDDLFNSLENIETTLIESLSKLTPAEQHQLLVEFNDTAVDIPHDRTVVHLFEEQSVKSPNATAVFFEGETLTYDELNERSNQLANYLKRNGIEKGSFVPICVGRSLEMIVGLLGIMKAGGVYVPIDPAMPGERISFMIEDTRARIILTNSACESALPLRDGLSILSLDKHWSLVDRESGNPLADLPGPSDLAYAIYTSGTTGKPKGVLIEHLGLVNVSLYHIHEFSMSGADRYLQFMSPAFDGSLLDIFTTLLSGGALILPGKAVLNSPENFIQFVKDQQISIFTITPSFLSLLNRHPLPGVRTIISAGEAAIVEDALYYASFKDFYNGYGPSEITVNATLCKVKKLEEQTRTIPIGRPMANRKIYILNNDMQVCPIGVEGEIYIGGIGVARGYLNNPELTAKRFLIDDFSDSAAARMYRTGDIGRWLPDGNIEFLGRMDDQVKVNGYRIELGEIESVIQQFEYIKQAVVVAREDKTGNKNLVAYVVPEGLFDQAAVISYLKGWLPQYMIPRFWVELESFPLTPNRKIDKDALPEFIPGAHSTNQYVAPRSQSEKTLVNIWQQVLDIERLGIDDHFFELGGNSLHAIRVISAIRKHFSVEMPISEIFLNPTISLLVQFIEQQIKTVQAPGIQVQRRPDHIPLSHSQERLWFIDQLEGSVPYHLPEVLHLQGKLDTEALEKALSNLVDRHEVLRTVFLQMEGQPYQNIKEASAWHLSRVDGSHFQHDASGLQRYISGLISEPFDLSRDYMFRARLISMGVDDHVLVLVMHHIASDGWSMSIMVKEIAELYEAYAENRPANLLPPAIQFADYAIWQRDHLQGEILDRKIGYWKQKLDGVASLQLPTDYDRPSVWSNDGSSFQFDLNRDQTVKLKTLSQQQGTTLFMTLLAAFKVLLHKYSGQQDICVGSPIANRMEPEVEGSIGFFVNTLAIRTEVDSASSFTELLQQVKLTMIEAYENQEAPFEKVVDVVLRDRDLSRNPLFQVMLVLQNVPDIQPFRLGGMIVSAEEYKHSTSQFDLTFTIKEKEDHLQVQVEYSNALYHESTVVGMADSFKQLLYSIVEAPNKKIVKLSMLTTQEAQRLLYEFNNSKVDYPKERTIVDLFEDQVTQTPQLVAVILEEEHLTYGELDGKANQLAKELANYGVKKNELVPIIMAEGIDYLVSFIAILKLGAICVPLGNDWPIDRIASILLEINPACTLLNEGSGFIKGSLEKEHAFKKVDFRKLEITYAGVNESSPDGIMCVFYTSGSTGIPKGVEIYHKGIANRFFWMNDYFSSSPKNVLKTTRNIFDSSIWQLLWPLINGGKTVLGVEQVSYEVDKICKLIESHKITTIDFSPALFQLFVDTLFKEELVVDISSLNDIIIGGEAINVIDVNKFKERYPGIRITNLYGPTEASIGCIHYTVTRSNYSVIPIGVPIANTSVYILDNDLQAVPIGVAGEIFIAGVCLAKGYLNRPDLTKQKFVANPFIGDPDARMYRTGDLARWLPDGNIQYLGRKDDQVKIRGYRIEPGEIENVLKAHESIKQAVVVARGGDNGNKRLVCYVVMSTGQLLNEEAILFYLKGKLPEYMVPSMFMELQEIPLTSGGKIDKKALPDPDNRKLVTQFVAPCNEIEVQMVFIWQELLGIQKIGTNDNFFHLGGHSLLAMRVISATRKKLGVELNIKELFLYPTISQLAEHLQAQSEGVLLPAIRQQTRPHKLPLSFSQEGLWFMDQLEGSVHYHLPMVLRFTGRLNKEALQFALQNIVNRHEVLRTVIKGEDGVGYQYIQEVNDFKLSITDGSHYRQNKEAENCYIRNIVNKPFDLSKDLMLRAEVIDFSNDEYVLVLNMHHIASDGWSLPIFAKELVEFYSAHDEGRSPSLLPLHIQYADYALWQRAYLQGEALDKNLEYWRKKLKGVQFLELPTDYRRSGVTNTSGTITRFTIDKSLVNELELLSNQQGATLFMTAFAAFNVLLHRYTNQDDICVGGVIAGRQQHEVEDLIGLFVNTLALRVKVSNDFSFVELLEQVKTLTLEAYEYQEVPFKKVVEVAARERDLGRNPLFPVMFVWHNTPEIPELHLAEVKLSREPFTSGTAKFDVTFTITETLTGLEGSVEYRTDLYEANTIDRMIGHFKELLSSIIKTPKEKIDGLPMLTKSEQDQLLGEFNERLPDYSPEETIVDFFERQAVKTPRALAVICEEEQLTYEALNEKANQLAHYLRSKNLQLESLVPICIDRSVTMLIGILAVLKAGGAYVPIDPAYPGERIAYLLADTRASVVVCNNKNRAKLSDVPGIEVVDIDTDRSAISVFPTINLKTAVQPHHVAYVIYTSGSTGKPKGVMIEHSSVVNLVIKPNYVTLSSKDRLLSTASPSFDVTTFEYWGMLLNGGQLILCSENTLLDTELIKRQIEKRQVNKMWFASSWFNQLVETDITIFSKLETILVGGEKLSEQHVGKVKATYPFITVINGYGPTENTTFSLTHPVNAIEEDRSIPIGRPLTHRVAYILNQKLALVPIGITGEICVGGAGLAKGYLNRPQLTDEKFIKNPFSSQAESRLYKTGDLGRWLADGTIEYLGRIDDQVKIRGYRIELGEIESVLQQCDLVSQAVVLSKEDNQGNKRLVAYIVADGPFDRESITQHLKRKLPDYMIPQQLVEMTELPLNTNGKIERKALPNPDFVNLEDHQYIAPRNEAEKIIAQIWEEVLKVEKISINDNFFKLGGHSLLILKMVSRIRKLGVKIEAKDLFGYQTIEQQSNFVKTSLKLFNAAAEGKFIIPIQKEGTNTPLFAFPEYLLYSEIGKHISRTQPFYSIEDSPFKTVPEIADHYISEIKKIYPKGPYYLAGYCNWGKIAVEMAHKLIAQGDEVPALVLIEYYSPKVAISRASLEFLRSKAKFIIERLKAKVSFVDKGKFLSDEFMYAFKYIHRKIVGASLKGSTAINKTYTGKVILFQASQTYGYKSDSHMGWSDIFTGDVKKVVIDGGHLNIMIGPGGAQIATNLNALL